MSEYTEVEKIVFYKGEVMLLAWGESNTRGRTVTFQLNEDGDAHPFKEMTVKKGGKAGQRMMMVLVEIGEDEQPVPKTPAQLAYLLCKDQAFQHFANERSFVTVDSEETARAYILEGCGIKSRSELDHSMAARAAWERLIWQPWQEYRKTMEGHIV